MAASLFILHSNKPYMKIKLTENIRYIEYLSFLYKMISFIVIIFILDYSIGSILNHYYFKQKSGFIYRTTYSICETSEDLLIFGSSKATHQYYPDIFEKRLNMSYFNTGRDGSSIIYQYAVLKAVLKRYSPKIIILDAGRVFEKKQDNYDRLSMLLPYYETQPEMRPIIELKSPFEKYKFLSKIYPYNSMLFSIVAGNSNFNMERNKDIKGYLPLSKKWDRPIATLSSAADYDLDSINIRMYESFIRECIKSKVKLYIVSSPHFYKLDFVEKSIVLGKEIANKYKVKYLDFTKDSLFLNKSDYFADVGHLNNIGAVVFSNLIVDEILKDYESYKPKLYN